MKERAGAAVAAILNHVLSAPIMAVVTVIVVAATSLPRSEVNLKWTLLAVVFFGLVPLTGYVLPLLIGRDKEREGSRGAERRQKTLRLISFVVNLASYKAGVVVLVLGKGPPVLTAVAVSYLATAMVLALVNVFYRASGHASGVAGPVAALCVLHGAAALPGLVLVPLVGWARVRTKGHTWPQTVAGAAIAAAATVGSFAVIL
jgi:membrane-associated phospholipid phosphatase